ncbi:MAG: phosphoglycerate dehydrogenase [Armatimonadetes bacterium]|nr:phosphoglycerate dehydrogenase [Armatimonadota bacterium]
MSWRVLVTARAFWVSGQPAKEYLEAAGCEVVYTPEAGPLKEDVLIERLQGFDAIIGSSDPYNAHVFASCRQLKVVSRCGVGIDSVDVGAATKAGIIVTNTPGAMTDSVGDYTFALLLGITRRIHEGDALMRSGGWGEYPGVAVAGKTLGLVGCGQIGQAVAKRAGGFSMRILAYDPMVAERGVPSGLPPIEFTDLDTVLAESDFVSLHAPNLPETKNMFNRERFAKMKSSAYFINTARGALVDEAALVEALENGTIAGAATDVYQQEPLPADSPLRRAPRCLLTPHNAFNSAEAAEAMSIQSAENTLAALQGEHPLGLINSTVLESAQLRIGK